MKTNIRLQLAGIKSTLECVKILLDEVVEAYADLRQQLEEVSKTRANGGEGWRYDDTNR